MTTVVEAYDLMLLHGTEACAGITVVYADDPPAAALDGKLPWARVTVKHAGGGQKGFGDDKQHHLRIGIFCIEIFTPAGDGFTAMHPLVEQALVSIENRKSYPVWYRNIRAAEGVRDGGYQKTNIYANFEYDSLH